MSDFSCVRCGRQTFRPPICEDCDRIEDDRDSRGPDEGDGFDTRETPEPRSETPFRCDSEQWEDSESEE